LKNNCASCKRCVYVCPKGAQNGEGNILRDICDACGKCSEACFSGALSVIGMRQTAARLSATIEKDKPFFDESSGGATFSGGEPLLQINFLEEILTICRRLDVHTAVDTAGCVPFEYFQRIVASTDLFLYDIKLYSEGLHRKYTGVSNKLILHNLKKLESTASRLWIRIPLIVGINDTEDEMGQIASFLAPLRNVERIEILPYHAYGMGKYLSLDKKYELSGSLTPSDEFLQRAEEIFNSKGIKPIVQK
jgi:pyruvate formate lyase activating enzyme